MLGLARSHGRTTETGAGCWVTTASASPRGTCTTAGLSILDRNWRCAHGEIDLVARDGDCLVFCEVKTRRSVRFGDPVEAITPAQGRPAEAAGGRLAARARVRASRIRIDVVGIVRPAHGPAIVRHLVGVGA